MAKLKQKVNINEEEGGQIRRQWDLERGRFYYSITDVIGVLTESVDARNYWKALKNRLKNSQNQLVSECNQLKLPSSDGKSYMVDVADRDTMIKIIRIIDPTSIPAFITWFDHIDVENSIKVENITQQNLPEDQISENTENEVGNELSTTLEAPADIYENKNEIVIKFMLAGCDPSKLILSVSMQKLSIKGSRILQNISKISEENYFVKELQWGRFERIVELPTFVDVDNIVAVEFQGLITITLTKIDLDKKRFLKIKSV